MPQEQIENVRNIARRVQEVGKEHGLKMLSFSVSPSLDDAPDRVSLAFEFDPDGANTPEIQIIKQANQELTDAMEAERKKEIERRRQKAREDLEGLEETMGGRQGFLEQFIEEEDD
jgi:hypothetical protein